MGTMDLLNVASGLTCKCYLRWVDVVFYFYHEFTTPSPPFPSGPSTMLLAPTTEATHGTVTYVPENEELAAEETVEIIYAPPEGLFKDPDSLLYCGGFNGWDGEEDALTTPMMPTDDGKFRVSITVPNFAKVQYSGTGRVEVGMWVALGVHKYESGGLGRTWGRKLALVGGNCCARFVGSLEKNTLWYSCCASAEAHVELQSFFA